MGKKVWGRKRHALVDVEGHLMGVKVTAASDSDLAGGKKLLEPMKEQFPHTLAYVGRQSLRGKPDRLGERAIRVGRSSRARSGHRPRYGLLGPPEKFTTLSPQKASERELFTLFTT